MNFDLPRKASMLSTLVARECFLDKEIYEGGATPYQRGVQMCPGGISGKGRATQITVKIETQRPG